MIEKFVAEMLDQTETMLNKAEGEPGGTGPEEEATQPAMEETFQTTAVPELSPDVEQMLEQEIQKIVMQEQVASEATSGIVKEQSVGAMPLEESQGKGSVNMPRGPAAHVDSATAHTHNDPAIAAREIAHYAELADEIASQPRTFSEWLLPKIVPGMFLLLVSSMVLAVADGSFRRVIWSHVETGFGFQSVLALAQTKRGHELVLPLLFIVGGWVFSNWLAFAAQRRMLDFFMVDETTALFLQGLVKWGSLAIAISVIIRAMGYKTAGLDALLASSGVAIAFASQTVLKNFAAGLIILLFRPFQVGDRIKLGDVEGTVTAIGILETQVITDAGVRITYSNGTIKENSLENLTMHGMRRVEVPVTVVASADAIKTRQVIEEAVEPFMDLWTKQPVHARAPRLAKQPNRTKSIGELVLGRSAIQIIMNKYRKAVSVLDRNGDGVVSGSELLGALSGDLLKRIAGDVSSGGSRFAKARRGYVICVGASELGIRWYAHMWVPSNDHDGTFVGASEAIIKALQANGIKIAAKAK